MSTNKVEMSLDEIIKANKNKSIKKNRANGNKGRNVTTRKSGFALKNANRGGKVQKRGGKVQKRGGTKRVLQDNNTSFRKNIASQRSKKNNNFGQKNQVSKATTIATKKLVQNLVKKALAQRNVRNLSTATPIRRRGGVRFVKKTVVLNRVSPRSRAIGGQRRRNVPTTTVQTIAARVPIRYNTVIPPTVQIAAPPLRNYTPRRRFNNGPNFVRQVARRQAYQLVPVASSSNTNGRSVRQQINAMRSRIVYVDTQQQQKPQFRRKQFLPQQRKRFQNNNRRQKNPFYEPQNFLQRIPVQQTIVRRFQN